MPVSKKPRRKHRPRPLSMPILYRHSAAADLDLALVPHIDLERMRTGAADDSAWHTLAVRLNVGQVLALRHFDEPVRDAMECGVRALASVWERHDRTHQWGFGGEEFRAVADALNATDDMQAQTTRAQIRDALRLTLKAASGNGKAGELLEVAA